MVDSPSGEAPAKAPRWDLVDTEGCGGGNRFSWCSWMFLGYMGIYRRKKYVGGRPRSPRDRGARPIVGRAPSTLRGWVRPHPHGALVAPLTYLLRLYIHVPRKHPGAPRKTISAAATFCIREIPSWSLRRCSAGGGIDHGGPLYHLQGLSVDL